MNDTRPVKALLFGELEGSRKMDRPLLRYKDTCKMALHGGKVLNEWNAVVNDRESGKHSYKMCVKCTTRKEKLTTKNEDRNVTNANCNSIHACNYDLYPYRITKGDIYM